MRIAGCYRIALFAFKPETPRETIDEIIKGIRALKNKFPGIVDLSCGPYTSDEGLNRGYDFGLMITFESAAHLEEYLPHPEHRKVGDLMMPHLAPLPGDPKDVMALCFNWISE
jgi:hypothetical protein